MRLFFPFLLFFNIGIQAQTNQWKVKTLFDEHIELKYRISKRIDDTGVRVALIEDYTTTTDSLCMHKCISFMKDVTKHKHFAGDKISKFVRSISDSTWIVYYYSDNPWPVRNSDCVALMRFTESPDNKTAIFSLTAAPTEYESKGVNRMTNYNITYLFEDLANGKVRITMTGRTSPPVKVPLWLIKSAFPKTTANAIRKLATLIKQTE